MTAYSVAALLSVSMTVLGASAGFGQDYPVKPIRIVTSGAGGGSDFVARTISSGISGPLGQPVVIDNRGGGVAPMETASKAPADGHTLLVTGAVMWITPLFRKAPYAVTDFTPVCLAVRETFILVVHPSLPVKSLKELIALAKAKPDALNYGSGNVGGTAYLGMELFKTMAGIKMVQIPFKSTPAVMTALLSGDLHLAAYDANFVVPLIKEGKVRALAVTSADPSALAPGLPTVAEAGLPGYELVGRTGVLVAGKTSTSIVTRLNQEIVRALNQPEVKERFLKSGVEVVAGSADQFAAVIKAEMTTINKLIKDAGIKTEL